MDWNSFGRANAAQTWRKQSAAMGRHMTEALVAEARVERGMHVLDAACGTGEPGISIATLLDGTGSVTGFDLAAGPLQIAAERAAGRNLRNIAFARADVQTLPFVDHSFDRITCRLGLMFFADTRGALTELRRVLKPGGRVSMVMWGPLEQPYFETTVVTVARMLGCAAPSDVTLFRFAQSGSASAALRGAGFTNVTEELRAIDWSWAGTPEEVWAYFQEVTVPFRPLLDSIPAERRAEVQTSVLREIGKYYDGKQVNFTASVIFASAEK